MIESSILITIAILLPLVAAATINLFSDESKLRNYVGMGFAGLQIFTIFEMGKKFLAGDELKATFFEILPNIHITFELESLGLIYAAVASSLWLVTLIYAHGYMAVNGYKNLTRFYIFFSIAIACSMGIAFSGNLITMFIFYEILTISTYPLVTHKGDADTKKSGRTYLAILIGASLVLFLPAIVWTNLIAGTTEFTRGGVFGSSDILDNIIIALMLMFAFGIGKAAIMPVHKWLPAAMVAPTPVSALLHAVAVVKAGVFCIAKIIFYILGTEKLASIGGADLLAYLAAFTIITASLIAIRQDNLKRRLAYSTIAQLSYIVLAAAIFSTAGIVAAAAQIVAHAVAKITLFFSAGAIATATGKKQISDLDGMSRATPLIAFAFLITSLSMIGLPLLAGGESKNLITAAAHAADKDWIAYILYASMALNAIYYLPISYRMFFKKGDIEVKQKLPISIKIAVSITTALTILYFSYLDIILEVMSKL